MIPHAIQRQVATVAIRAYVAHSWLYYEKDDPQITDAEYDALCKWLHENYEWVKQHDISDYLDKSELSCGSGFVAARKIAGPTRDYAQALLDEPQKKRGKRK